jgi:uncharacterized protein GlcG (DUF336 family)
MKGKRVVALAAALITTSAAAGLAQETETVAGCHGLPGAAQLRQLLRGAAQRHNPDLTSAIRGRVGGLFEGQRMWAAVVNRDGVLCAFETSTFDRTQVWPGSQAIAKAKAYTANAFSLDITSNTGPLSTALIYTLVQPGHSLFGLNESNPFNPDFLATPEGVSIAAGPGGGLGKIAGGIISFGGGVALYQGHHVVGGLGVSGDTACADHEISKRVRDLAGLNPAGSPTLDDITYSPADGASPFTHPVCPNTFRNGTFIGNEQPATGY